MIEILAIHHIQITVPAEHEEACRHFYRTVMGLEEIAKPKALQKNSGSWYRHGDMELHLSRETVKGNEASRRHICYMVTDLESARRHLESADVEILEDNQPIEEWMRFYVRDPGGNRLEIAQKVPVTRATGKVAIG